MRRRIWWLPVGLLLGLLVMRATVGDGGSRSSGGVVAREAVGDRRAAVVSFREWVDRPTATRPEVDREVLEWARARREVMLGWMRDDPERALEESLGWAEHAALPGELKPLVERPFNAAASLVVLPICGTPDARGREPLRVLEMDGRSWEAQVLGRRSNQDTKESTPLAGITLGGRAVVAAGTFEQLSREDAGWHARTPLGQADSRRDFASGEPIVGDPVVALAAGRRFHFASAAGIERLNDRLGRLDDLPGPHGGSRALLLADGDPGGLDLDGAGEWAEQQADSWTETPKSVFFIRVDFSDVPGEVVSEASLANTLNTAVADSIAEMSYGKTTITAGVSATTVRMPQPTSHYLPNDNLLLHADAVAAYEAIAGAGALGSHDIIGVHFDSIGIQSSSGVTYAGLAGGSRQWIQGTSSSNVIIHEFGHNYGIGHASFWETTDGSVVGAGSNDEYGDDFDIMGNGPDPEGHFHMQAKSRLNWLEDTEWIDADVAGSGIHRIHRFDDDATSGPMRGIRVTKAAGEYYWIGYRPGIPDNPYLGNGAYLLWQRPGYTRSWLLDTTPDSAAGVDDAALVIGSTYSDPTADVHLTPVGKGGTGADQWLDVNVQIGPFPGNQAPTAVLTAPATTPARNAVTLEVVGNDGDGDPLVYQWDFGDGTMSGNSASVSHTWQTGGSYTVSVTVSDMKGGSVTESAVVTVTDPLDNWTTGSVAAGLTMRDVRYLGGRYLAGVNNALYLSIDGTSWEEAYSDSNLRSGDFASGGGRFVLAGYDWDADLGDWRGEVWWSDDGRSWIRVGLPLVAELRDVAAGPGGEFVAVGDGGLVLLSTDGGESWTTQPTPGTNDLDAVAWGDGTYVAVGEDNVFTSTDGMNWVDRSSGTQLLSWHTFKDVVFLDGAFLAGGWYSGIQRSTDGGISWESMEIVGDLNYDVRAMDAVDGMLVAATERKSSPAGPVLLVSADGLSWVESTAVFPLTSSIAIAGGEVVSVHGTNGELSRSDALFPANTPPTVSISGPSAGDARTLLTFSTTSGDADGDPLGFIWDFDDGSLLDEGSAVVHGFPGGGTRNVTVTAIDGRGGITTATHPVTISDPLENWTTRSSGTTADLFDITVGGGKLLAVGDGSGTFLESTDGISWSGGTIGINIRLRGVVHDGSQFVAVGYDYDFGPMDWLGAIYTSPDGSSWTRRHFGGAELRDVAHGGGVLVATGDAGTMWTSTDGITWNPVATGVAEDLDGVSYGNGGFVAVGAGSGGGPVAVLGSANGSSWTDHSPGAGTDSWQGFYDVQYCHDRFLASGWYSRIRHSTDGGASFATTRSGTEQVPAFAHGNGTYLAAGVDKGNADADINLLSTDGETWSALTTAAQDNREAMVFFDDTFITVGRYGSIQQSDPFVAPELPGFAGWQAMTFPGLPPLSGAEDDFDGDGVANLVEYVTGSDATDAGDRPAIVVGIVGDRLRVTIPRVVGSDDVTVAVDHSLDLENWSPAGVTVVEDGVTQLVVEITEVISYGASPRGFLRPSFTLGE